jgi:hypothetical protein
LGNCNTCSNGYYVSSGKCTVCKTGCSQCSSATSCSTCQSGYYLSTSKSCVKCTDVNCSKCSSTACQTCNSGYVLKSGKCTK